MISAIFPTSIVPLSIFISLAGLYDVTFTKSKYVKSPVSTRFIISAGKAVSNPIIPFGAFDNSCAFSSSECGAWSVIMQSIVPSFSPSIIANLSFFSLSGGFIFAFVPLLFTSSTVNVK